MNHESRITDTRLVCPECGGKKFKLDCVLAGKVAIDFEGKGKILDMSSQINWSDEDPASCMDCEWEGEAKEAQRYLPSGMIDVALKYIQNLPMQEGESMDQRVKAIKSLKRAAKEIKMMESQGTEPGRE